MFLKITRMMYFDTLNSMMYFDTLNSNMTIAKRYEKPFLSYKKMIYKKIWKISRTP